MKVIAVALVVWFISAVPAGAARFGGVEELYFGPSVDYFQWKEFLGGTQVVKESGPLFGVDATVDLNLLQTDDAGALKLKGKLGLFGGDVDYDGSITSTNPAYDGLPVKSDVVHFGVRQEVDLGWRLPLQEVAVEPFGGIGYRWWLRDIDNSTTRDLAGQPLGVQGYTEYWQTVYARVGARGRYDVNGDLRFFVEGGARYPFYTENEADFPGVGTVTVKPGGAWSAFAEAGFRYRNFRTGIHYEGFRFAQSPGVRGYSVSAGKYVTIYQPRSESDVVGISFSWAIK